MTALTAMELLLALVFLLRGGTGAYAGASLLADSTAGAISIRAWLEQNDNGLPDPGEPAVSGLHARVTKATGGLASLCETGDSGVCHVNSLEPGTYYILVEAPSGLRIVVPYVGSAVELIEVVQPGQTTAVFIGLQAAATATPTKTGALPGTSTVTRTATPSPSGTRTATSTATPSYTATATPTRTRTPTPTASALPIRVRTVTFQHGGGDYPRCENDDPNCYRLAEDTYLDVSNPDRNYDAEFYLRLKSQDSGEAMASLIKFDLFPIPANAEIISATLSIYLQNSNYQGEVEVGAYRVLRPWKAGEATWRSPRAGEQWASGGCNGIGGDRDGTPAGTTIVRGASRWYHIRLDSLVAEWVRNPAGNYGVALKVSGTMPQRFQYEFTSSNSLSVPSEYRPKLRVAYRAPATALNQRIGVGIVTRYRCNPAITRSPMNYNLELLRIGWYSDWAFSDWWYALRTLLPIGMDYVHLIEVGKHWPPDWNRVAQTATWNPGMLWIIGNEPEDYIQSGCTPAQYAQQYREAYTFIKQRDPTARIAVGGVVVPTPLRLRWLEMVLEEYQRRYGEPLPADAWTIHVQILPDVTPCWRPPVGVAPLTPGPTCTPIPSRVWPTLFPSIEIRNYDFKQNASFAEFVRLITEFRTWMRDHGQRDKPLIISEYGVLFSPSWLHVWGDDLYGREVLKDYMTLTFDYLLQAKDSTLGYPGDENRLVQRWLWYSANEQPYDNDTGCGFNGALFDWLDPKYPGTLKWPGTHFMRYMHALEQPPTSGITVTTGTGTDIVYGPLVTLSIWARDWSAVRRIAISGDPASVYMRQYARPGETPTPFRPPTPEPALDRAEIRTPPASGPLTLQWDVTRSDRGYPGPQQEGSRTIFVRLQGTDGRWSRLWVGNVVYVRESPTPTVTSTAPHTPTATWTPIFSPTPTPSPTSSPSATHTPFGMATGTPTATEVASRTATPTATRTPKPTNSLTVTPTATDVLGPTGTPVSTGTSTTTPTRTQVFSPTATATDTPVETDTPTPTATASTGNVCVRVFHDRNGDYLFQPESEERLAGARIALMDQWFNLQRPIYITTGVHEPYCFTDLPPGNYYLREEDPPGYTSELNYFSVPVLPSRTIVVSFGDRAIISP